MAKELWTEYWEVLLPVSNVWHWQIDWFEGSELLGNAFFCSECGAIWGRKYAVPPSNRMPKYWMPISNRCRRHGGGSFLPSLAEFSGFVGVELRERRASHDAILNEFLAATRPQNDHPILPTP